MTVPLPGGCLCGAVRFTAVPQKEAATACHCGLCRRWTSSVFMGVDCGDTLAFEGEPKLGVYPSSEWGERVFCPTCGSSLFWRMRDGSSTEVAAQAFDDPSGLPLRREAFVDEQPSTYAFADRTERLTGAAVLAQIEARRSDP